MNELKLIGYELTIITLLNWSILFILDDFAIISTYSIELKVIPLQRHNYMLSTFSLLIFIGSVVLLYKNSFDIYLNYFYVFLFVLIMLI